MKLTVLLSATVGLILFAGLPALAGSFTYADFSSIAGLSLVGSAAQVGNVVTLTPNIPSQAGALWFGTPISVAAGFTSTFVFQIIGDPGLHADGLAFVIQGLGPGALGAAGGGIGYHGMPNSLAVEFDTWSNGAAEPPATDPANHVAVHSCGVAPNSFDYSLCGLGGATAALPMVPGQFPVTLSYIPGMLTISSALATFDVPVNLASLLNLLPDGQAYIGFTAATGGFSEVHNILSWGAVWPEQGEIPEPSTTALIGAGVLVLGVLRCRR